MIIETQLGARDTAILIPTKGRGELIRKTFKKMPFLNSPDTFIGVEEKEVDLYKPFFASEGFLTTPVFYDNPEESVGLARERLRQAAVVEAEDEYDMFVCTDDNAVFTAESLINLVRCSVEFPRQPAIAMGYHGIHQYFNRGKKLYDEQVVNGIRSYEHVSNMQLAVPRQIMAEYRYPDDCHAGEDRHMILWCFAHGYTEMRICVDAVFNKRRGEPGGSGSFEKRQIKFGLGLSRLAKDFPQYLGMETVDHPKWRYWFQLARGYNFPGKKPRTNQTEEAIVASMVRAGE